MNNPKTHDALFKWLITAFTEDFFEHYFPDIHIGAYKYLIKSFRVFLTMYMCPVPLPGFLSLAGLGTGCQPCQGKKPWQGNTQKLLSEYLPLLTKNSSASTRS